LDVADAIVVTSDAKTPDMVTSDAKTLRLGMPLGFGF
jgi:hypothetical protein